jgi:hypothetical protein
MYRWILRAQLSLLSQSSTGSDDTEHTASTVDASNMLHTIHIALVTATALIITKCDWSVYKGNPNRTYSMSAAKATVNKNEQYRQLKPVASLLSMVLDCPMQPLQYIDKQLAKRTVRILHAIQDDGSAIAISIPTGKSNSIHLAFDSILVLHCCNHIVRRYASR